MFNIFIRYFNKYIKKKYNFFSQRQLYVEEIIMRKQFRLSNCLLMILLVLFSQAAK